MKLLVLTKRQYTNKDLIDDRYGRLWEIPLCLVKNGHHVKGICLSYRNRRQGVFLSTSHGDSIEWISFNISSLFSYLSNIRKTIKSFNPDAIWASSDCFHIVFGYLLGKFYHVPCVVDLYDNYEAYKLSKNTGIIPLYRWIVKNADAVSVVSTPLKALVISSYRAKGKVSVIENAANTEIFFPRDKIISRKTFNLPEDAKIIGTAGALDEGRGIGNLYNAFELLCKDVPNLYLAVAGLGCRNHPIFRHPKVFDLGVLSNQEVAILFNAFDIAVICIKDNDFGKYSFPQKAHEILSSKVPLISAKVGSMAVLLRDYPGCLFDPSSPVDLAKKIALQLIQPTKLKIHINTWAKQAESLEFLLKNVSTFQYVAP